tara:strand:+ start:4336 stop:5832 length:1497 start_codon:yes stop_codon:yes gene_type:complete
MSFKKEKINISYLNLAAQSPSLELNLSLSEKIHRKDSRNKHIVFMCNRALKSCSVNILHKKSVCNLCVYKAKEGFRLFKERNPNSQLVNISRKNLSDLENEEISNEVKKEILFGVHSTIGSQLRLDDMGLLDRRWKKIEKKMLESSKSLYSYFNLFMQNKNILNFVIFNGRLSCARPLIQASKQNKINYYLFDAAINGKVPMYSKNEMFHSISFEKRNALKTYLKFFKESKKLAEDYMNYKLNKIAVSDFSYTKNQRESYLEDSILTKKKPLISVFTSSDDEYRFIGSDWAKYGIVDQVNSIYTLINSGLQKDYDFIIKMHPNQNNIHKSIKKKYSELSENVTVIYPESKSDTYELIRKSEIIINFCSSVGIESNYLRKTVIQIGPSRFREFPAANYVTDAKDAVKLIKSKKFKIMPLRASILWFTYQMKSSFELPAYKYHEDGVFSFGDKFIKAPFKYRIMSVYDKLYYNISKGDFSFIKNFKLYFNNLIYGTTKVN